MSSVSTSLQHFPRTDVELKPKSLWHIGEHATGLDGLRGLAISAVLLVHFYNELGYPGGMTRYVGPIFKSGWAGVDLFFVLSGFLITGILLDTRARPHYFRTFYARRTLRIFPLYYGVLVLTLLICPVARALQRSNGQTLLPLYEHGKWLWFYVSNVAISFPQLGTPSHRWFNFDHFWSLAIEEQFYLVWPAVVLLANRRQLSTVCVLTLFIAVGSRAAMGYYGHGQPEVERFTLCRVDAFGAGGLLAILVREVRGSQMLRRSVFPFVALLLLVLVASYALRHHDRFGLVRDSERTLLALLFASLIALTLMAPANNLWFIISRTRVLRQLGKYSYGIYVWHFLLMPQFKKVLPMFQAHPLLRPERDVLFMSGGVIVSCGCAWVSWVALERPFLRLKRHFPNQERPK